MLNRLWAVAIEITAVLGFLLCLASTSHAHAQLRERTLRVWIDADVFSAGVVQQNPRGPVKPFDTTVISVGPNQLGNSRVLFATPSLGVGAAYVLKPKWMLGGRAGFGFDRVKADERGTQKALAISLMPELTFVPLGKTAKLFFKFSPIAQYNQLKQGSTRQHIFMGCFSFGVGTMVFTSDSSSIDVGGYFEGRFGKLKPVPDASYVDVNDLRGVIRAGVSLWR